MDIFESCGVVNDLLVAGREAEARNELIRLLGAVGPNAGTVYKPLLNRLIRDVGLYPYMDVPHAGWTERYVYEAFKADVGEQELVTLHLEQRRLLEKLLSGRDVAVSAPTSFGKSFVVDAFIAMRRPLNVVILVPTIALADETRRRLQRKFGDDYKLITTGDQLLAERNIMIFPQERAFGYARLLDRVDILIVDEFYKASKSFDKERAPALIRSILEFGRIAKQRYYLAPNISELRDGPFTEGMEFIKLDFNTVFLEKTELYQEIGKDEAKKTAALLSILANNEGKSLVYAGTYSNIKTLANVLNEARPARDSKILVNFHSWLAKHYELNWDLTRLVTKGVGVHNGQLHRSLSQIQVRLFEEDDGLDQMLSTSSIIEGVNTSAKNVILWSNKNGSARINDFTYKNIIGRGGRMFRHFVGRIFILDKPPAEEVTQLALEYPDELLGFSDQEGSGVEYTPEQVAKIREYEAQMRVFVGAEELSHLQSDDLLQNSDTNVILAIAKDIRINGKSWNGLRHLNSDNVDSWDRLLYRLLQLQPGAWDTQWSKFVKFVKVLSGNWHRTIPELLDELSADDIGIDDFFKLERNTTFRLASLLGDVQTIYNRINKDDPIELAPAIARFSCAFLPRVVYQLEEYGLPRMLSKSICRSGMVDLEGIQDIHEAIGALQNIGLDALLETVAGLDPFDEYILRYFFDGLSSLVSKVA